MEAEQAKRHWAPWAAGLVLTSVLAGCATNTPQHPQRIIAHPPPAETARVFFYPTAGQSPAQQDRDRYECYQWAVKKTGFDPNRAPLTSQPRVEVQAVPPAGRDTAVGAVTGAAIGAAVSSGNNRVQGALVGAVAGATLGAISDASRQEEAQREQERLDRLQQSRSGAQQEHQALDFRRAMAACMEGRNYSVR